MGTPMLAVFFVLQSIMFGQASQVLLVKIKLPLSQWVRWVFSGISRFRPTLRLIWLKMSEKILTGRKTQIKKIIMWAAS